MFKQKRLLILNCALMLCVLAQFSSIVRAAQCPKSSACPAEDSNCYKNLGTFIPICQNVSGGCCEWLKYPYTYTSKPNHTCTIAPCGQWDGPTPVDGSFTTGVTCSGTGSGIVRGVCGAQ